MSTRPSPLPCRWWWCCPPARWLTCSGRGQRDATVATGVPPLFLIEDDYRIALLDAEASFITTFLGKLEDPENGWSGAWQAYHDSHGPGGPDETSTERTNPSGTTGADQ